MTNGKRTVVVSGVGRGLGLEFVKLHAAAGDAVYGWDRAVSAEMEALAAKYPGVEMYECDITNDEQVARRCAGVLQKAAQIDILYNVAGVHREEDLVDLADTDISNFLTEYSINAVGPMRVTKALLGGLKAGSVVLTLSSEAGSIGGARRRQEYAYCMSKAALNMGMKLLHNQLFRDGVRFLLIHPGWLRSPMGGARAAASPTSVSTGESAADILNLVNGIGDIPLDQLFMTHTGELLPW